MPDTSRSELPTPGPSGGDDVVITTTLITGANKGLGKHAARRLVAAGHTVFLGARDAERGRAAAQEIGARVLLIDVTSDESVAANMVTVQYAKAYPEIRFNAVDPGFTATDLNGNRGTQTV